tara:strand:+ start:1045 stop:1278 length:234 start_codon:yes stop_codon:yes gene_type:complete
VYVTFRGEKQMQKVNRIKQNIKLHEKIASMENTILDLGVLDRCHEDFDDNCKTIYKCLQNIKGIIYKDEIVFRKGAN